MLQCKSIPDTYMEKTEKNSADCKPLSLGRIEFPEPHVIKTENVLISQSVCLIFNLGMWKVGSNIKVLFSASILSLTPFGFGRTL